MTTTNRNYNDPRAHVHLVKLLDRPDELASETRPRVLPQLRQSLDTVMAMPEGDARINLLETLNTALGDALRYHKAYAETQVLAAQLKATHPEAAEISSHIGVLRQALRSVHSNVKQAQAMDKAQGIDVDNTAWFWFVHELYRITDFMDREMRTLERSAGVSVQLPSDED